MKSPLTLIKFKVTEKYYGYPDPHIETGTVVLLIQNGKVDISKYQEPTDGELFPSFIHPSKDIQINKEIEEKLYEYIKKEYPQYLLSPNSLVFLCSFKYLEEIIW